MRLTIDTATDTYEQAIAAVQAAYGMRPVTPADWPKAPALDPRPDPQDLSTDNIADGWTDQLLFRTIASLMPGARAVLRRIADLDGTASYSEVQQYFADHPTTPIPPSKIGGTLTSVQARARLYRIDRTLVDGLRRAFAMADARPDLLRGHDAAVE